MTSRSERHQRPRAISAQPPGNIRGGTPSRPDVSRSCIPCHRRKVRCDKNLPCAACARGGRDCTYQDVSDRPARRRPRKTTIADVASRVSDLERSIVASTSPAGGEAPPQRPSIASRPTAAEPEGAGEYAASQVAGEVLVQNGTNSRYIDEIAISRMIEAVRDSNCTYFTPSLRGKPGPRQKLSHIDPARCISQPDSSLVLQPHGNTLPSLVLRG
jgi:hypothetical protein